MPCKEHNLAEVGPKGGIRKSPKAPSQIFLIKTQKVKVQLKEMLKVRQGQKYLLKIELHYKRKLMILTKGIKKS